MDNKKRIVNLEYFREMLHICLRLLGQTFDELLFEEEILAFLRFLGYGREIRKLTDVNINKKTSYIKLSIRMPRRAMRCTIPGAAPPKTKASVRKTKSSSKTTITPPTAAGIRFSTSAKGKQSAKSSNAQLTVLSEVAMTEAEQMKLATKRSLQQTRISQASGSGADEGTDDDEVDEKSDDQDTDNDGDDFVHPMLSIHEEEANDEERFDPIVQTPENSDDEVAPLTLTTPTLPLLTAPTLHPPTIPTISEVPQAPTPPTTAPSTFLQDLLKFGSLFRFDHRLKTLEANFLEFVQTNQFAGAVSSILGIIERYMDQWMNEAVKIIKEQVKVQVFKILPRIEKTVNEQLEAKVLTRSSNSSKTSYVMVADLSKIELRKILIEKMESNKSIKLSDEQRNLYKALVDAYESDKTILDTYGDTITLKRRHDDADKDEEPSAGSDRGSKRRREGKEPESTSAPKVKATKTTSKSAQGSKSHQKTASESSPIEEPMQTTHDLEEPSHQEFETGAANDQPIVEASQHPECRKYTTFVTKTKTADYEHIKWIEDLVPRTMWSQEPVGCDKYALWESLIGGVNIVEWHNYKHMDWITVRRDDDKLYKFKEGDFKRLHIQDIEDMLLLLVQGKLTNPTVEERFAFNVSLRMFTRSIVIQRRVEDLQLGVESYQKKLNLTKPDTYRSDLKRKETYTNYFNPRGFIYQNKDKQNRLMRIDELHKFNDLTLNDVRTALDDRLKSIRMKYLPQAI
uniref:Retrovirus-related Pol polyprotein from transposon TNT 1-94 n=1 Tax=Tanacetum cinerariifolium TaxID=118510 RepID=A0A6L2M8D3_TANCI|nr:hypothetical protein [Tanacetum cinerariifolium]